MPRSQGEQTRGLEQPLEVHQEARRVGSVVVAEDLHALNMLAHEAAEEAREPW